MRRGLRVLAGVGVVLLGLASLTAAGGALLVGWLFTAPGSEALRRAVVPQISESIPGELEVDGLSLNARLVTLRGVVLRDPSGQPVLAAPLVLVELDPWALRTQRLHLERVLFVSPWIALRQGPRGLNLAEALGRPEERQELFPILVDQLRVSDARFSYLDARAPDARAFRARRVRMLGSALVLPTDKSVALALRMEGGVAQPRPGRLSVDLWMVAHDGWLSGVAEGKVADSALEASLTSGPGPGLRLGLESLTASAPLIEVFAPRLEPRGPVTAQGALTMTGSSFDGDLELRTSGGFLSFEGDFDAETMTSTGLVARGRDVNLAAVVPDFPTTHLDFELAVQGRFEALDTLEGTLRLDLPEGTVGGEPVGPVAVALDAEGGRVELSRLRAALPGLAISGSGGGPTRQVDLDLRVRATDLSRTAAFLRGLGLDAPPMAGEGEAVVSIRGPLDHPGVALQGRIGSLRVGERALSALSLQLRASDVRQPRLLSALATAERVELGDQVLEGLRLEVENDRRGVSLDVSVEAPQPLSLTAMARWDRFPRALTVQRLRLEYPNARWSLSHPAELTFKDGMLLRDLELTSGDARLALTASTEPLDGRLVVEGLALHDLPRLAQPEDLPLAGFLSGELTFEEDQGAPWVVARLRLLDARIATLRDADVYLTAGWDGARVDGQLLVHGLSGRVHARFDLPAQTPLPPRAPLRLSLEAEGLSVGGLLAAARPWLPEAAERVERAGGRLSAEVTIRGTQARPRVAGNLAVRRGWVELEDAGRYQDLELRVHGNPDRVVLDTLTANTERGSIRLQGRATRASPDSAYDVQAQLHAQRFPLPLDTPTTLSGRAQLSGTASPERAALDVTLEDVELRRPTPATPAGSASALAGAPPRGQTPPHIISPPGVRPHHILFHGKSYIVGSDPAGADPVGAFRR